MSGEVLLQETVAMVSGSHQSWYHDAIHDIESFLWVFIDICMTRCGPGGRCRPELEVTSTRNDEKAAALRQAVYDFFDAPEDELCKNKCRLLRHPEEFNQSILQHFHPYFHDLKALAMKWWTLLIHGYKFRMFEYDYIHTYTLHIFYDHIKKSDFQAAEDPAAAAAELERRTAHRDGIVNCFSSDNHDHSPPVASPSSPPEASTQRPPTPTRNPSPIPAPNPPKRQKLDNEISASRQDK